MATRTLLDPKENYIGNTVPWDGNCPFCREPTSAGKANCGWMADITGKRLPGKSCVVMEATCTKVAAMPKPANPNGPHNNIVGAEYVLAGPFKNRSDDCPFCGKNGYANSAYLCGFNGSAGIVTAICKNTASGPVPAKNAVDAAGRLLSKSVLPAKPTINCAACGAYGAQKHRLGCKVGIQL